MRGKRAGADDTPAEDRVSLIRWSRIWVALGMIGVAIVWLVIDNRLGLVDPSLAPTPVPRLARSAPALATPQVAAGVRLDPRFVARLPSVDGAPAPHGDTYLRIAGRVQNQGRAPLPLAPAHFHVRTDARDVATATGYTGHAAQLTATLAPGGMAQGYLTFLVPASLPGGLLRYTPGGRDTAHTLLWRLPAPP